MTMVKVEIECKDTVCGECRFEEVEDYCELFDQFKSNGERCVRCMLNELQYRKGFS